MKWSSEPGTLEATLKIFRALSFKKGQNAHVLIVQNDISFAFENVSRMEQFEKEKIGVD